MAYKVIILYQLYMPSYFLGTFTEYPYLVANAPVNLQRHYKLVKSDKEEGFTEFISKVL